MSVRSEIEAQVERVRSAAATAAATLGWAIAGSAAASLVAWGVLFGVRLGSGGGWLGAGVLALPLLSVPAIALWYLRRQFRFLATLPDQLGDLFTQVSENVDLGEIKEKLSDLSDKRGLRLALAVGSVVRWARAKVDVPTVTGTTARLGRMVATVPAATLFGVVGTLAVVLLIPTFAIASALLAIS